MMLAARTIKRHLVLGLHHRSTTARLSSLLTTRTYLRPSLAVLDVKPTQILCRGNETDTSPTDLPLPFNDPVRTHSTKKSNHGGNGGSGSGNGGNFGNPTQYHTPSSSMAEIEGEGAWSSVLTNPRTVIIE
jgi:hypothetical protein